MSPIYRTLSFTSKRAVDHLNQYGWKKWMPVGRICLWENVNELLSPYDNR